MVGEKKTNVGYQKLTITLPDGIHDEMKRLIESRRRWFDRVEFIREAIKEKIAREVAERPHVDPATAAQVRDRRV